MAGIEAHLQGDDVSTEDTELSGCTDQHQLWIGNQGREVGHGTDTEEDQRRIPTLLHTLIEDVQHGALLVDTQLQTSVFERNITDQDTEADGDQQHRLELIANRQEDEQQADEQHHDVPRRRVRESCVGEEDLNVLHQELRETLSCRL